MNPAPGIGAWPGTESLLCLAYTSVPDLSPTQELAEISDLQSKLQDETVVRGRPPLSRRGVVIDDAALSHEMCPESCLRAELRPEWTEERQYRATELPNYPFCSILAS